MKKILGIKVHMDKRLLTMSVLTVMFLISVIATVLNTPIAAQSAADIVAKRVTETMVVDGLASESFWQNVSWVQFPLTASAAGGGNVASVKVKIVNNGEYLFVLFQWDDPTASNNKSLGSEDRLAVMVSIGDPEMTTPCMQSGTNGAILAGEADHWHWKAARTDGGGANFTYVTRGGATYGPMPHPYSFAMDEYINTTSRNREGLSEYTEMNATKYPFEATLHLYDIQAKGAHFSSQWTLEMARKYTTEDPVRVDKQFTQGETFSFALAVYDGGEGEDEEVKSVTGWITAELSNDLLSPPIQWTEGPQGEEGPAGSQGEQGSQGAPAQEWLTYASAGGLIIGIIALAVSVIALRKPK